MPVSAAQAAKRALVKVLQTLAAVYAVVLKLTSNSTDAEVTAAYRKVAKKAHPDKGGTTEHAQQLLAAKAAWGKAKNQRRPAGRPKENEDDLGAEPTEEAGVVPGKYEVMLPVAESEPGKIFRIRSIGVLLTYFGVEDVAQWQRFTEHIRSEAKLWKVKHWCATLERSRRGKLHIHLMLQFTKTQNRTSNIFSFEGMKPRADQTDMLGDGFGKKKLQESLNRGMFYCWADKLGTERDDQGKACTMGNYAPCWTTDTALTYAVKGRWPEALWKAGKLSHEKYEEYLYACRDGVIARKRNLEACKAKEEADAQRVEMEGRVKRIRGNPRLFRPFPRVPEVEAWLKQFKADKMRYPILVVLGASHTGKTEWAKSLFRQPLELKVGALQHFPEGMRRFTRGTHDGLILDDVRDMQFVVQHQEKLQGKYDSLVEFASTPGGALAYTKDLFAVPVVVTANYTTANRDMLHDNDWLKLPENRVLIHFPPNQQPDER